VGGRTAAQWRRFRRLRAFDRDADPEAWAAGRLAGVDEAGVGPLAGPVVAAAVILAPEFELPELDDSKRLSAAARSRCERSIRTQALAWAIARVSPRCIDRINILRAMLRAHGRALRRLDVRPTLVLVDGNRLPAPPAGWQVQLRAVVRGDQRSLAVAAASVLAKCARDRAMLRLDRRYPGYGFARHKGYATEEHVLALRRLGPSPVHRGRFCRFLADEAELARQLRFDWAAGAPPAADAAVAATSPRGR
jgi:ribonuclease HII